MGILDWILVAPILYGVGKGLWGGALNEWSGLAGIVLGIFAARGFKSNLADWLQLVFDAGDKSAQAVAFLLIFVGVMVVVVLLGKALTMALKWAWLGWANRAVGGLLGAIKYFLLVAVLVHYTDSLLQWLPLVEDKTLSNSYLYGKFCRMGAWIVSESARWVQG
jgi:membrane protein required for colicin V production